MTTNLTFNEAAVQIRNAEESDMPAIQAIYWHHVMHGFGSFEEAAPDVTEMTRRWCLICDQGLPFLVGVIDGSVLGYAYVGPFRPRSAYRHTIEDSIYISPDAQRRGIGRLLLEELITRCTDMGFRQMVAVIGDSGNMASIKLHLAMGFRYAGSLLSVGFKFGSWVDSVMMQRALGEGDANLPPPK
jgi:L-amino acid N-acyltransferase YncA